MKRTTLNPVRLLAGPIFTTEMRIGGRHISTYVLRFLFSTVVIGFFAVVLLVTWAESNRSHGGTVADLQRFQKIAPQLGTTVLWTQYVGLLLLTPIMLGSAICGERRSRTLAALLTTPLSAWEILLSKLTGRMTQILILAAVSLPLLLASRMLGGLSIEGIFAAAAVTFTSVLLMASLTLAASISARKPTSASAQGFSLFLTISFGPSIVAAIYNFWFLPNYPMAGLSPIPVHWINASSLPLSLGLVSFEHFVGSPTGLSSMQTWGWSVILGLSISMLTLLVAGARMRRTMQRDPEGDPKAYAKPKRSRVRKGQATEQPAAVVADVTRKSRTVGDHPVLWRELRQPLFRTKVMFATAILAIVALVALLAVNDGFSEPATYYALTMIGLGSAIFHACYGTTGSISSERETRTLDVLLTTPIKPSAIVLGKYVGALRKMIGIPLALYVLYIIGSTTYIHWSILILMPIIVVPPILLFTATGMLCGVYMRNIAAAMTNVGLAVGLYMVLPISIVMIENFSGGMHRGNAQFFFTGAIAPNPFVMIAIAIEGTGEFYGRAISLSSLEFSFPYRSVSFAAFLTIVVIGALVQLVAAAGALAWAMRALPVRHGRAS
ncbi:MAG: ABC transporter permease subunit [Phycisphaeraceae bacterium]|nr:ABC transporter permease subunit [Phycisphaeraceae bacterium]MCW5762555.1 ABC transporter permease subunit [Phycisphaeraceae bacterium]